MRGDPNAREMLQGPGDTQAREVRGKGREELWGTLCGEGIHSALCDPGEAERAEMDEGKVCSRKAGASQHWFKPRPHALLLVLQVFKQWMRVWCKDFKTLSFSTSL